MGFYSNLLVQCRQKGVAPSVAAKEIGLSNAAASGWKSGKIPHDATLYKLSAYFGCTVEDLLKEEAPATPPIGRMTSEQCELMSLIPVMTPEEVSVLLATARAQVAARKAQDSPR